MKTKRFLLVLIAILAGSVLGIAYTSTAATLIAESAVSKTGISNEFLRIQFDPKSGELVEMIDLKSGKNFINQKSMLQSLWRLETGKQQWIEISDAESFYCKHVNALSLELTWTHFKNNSPELKIIVSVHLLKDEPMSEWHIKIDNMKKVNVETIHFPCIPDISKLGNN